MDIKIFHNPRCKKSRAGLEYLRSKTEDMEIIEYLKIGISEEEIKFILKISGLNVSDLIRKQEEFYKKEIRGKSHSDKTLIKYISENPKLLQRPIVIKKELAVIGDPPQNIDRIFK